MADEHSFLANSSIPSIDDMEIAGGNNNGGYHELNESGYLEEESGHQYQQPQNNHNANDREYSRSLATHTLLDEEYGDDDDNDEDYEQDSSDIQDDDDEYIGDDDDDDDNYASDDDEDDEDYIQEEGEDDSRLPDETGIEYSDESQSQGRINNMNDHEIFTAGLRSLESQGLVDIGNIASWSVSSSKSNCGVKELRDDSPDTYWQSDGNLPHFIQIHFTKKVSIERLSLYLDYALDESYTPGKIQILAGSGEHDLMEVITKEFTEPTGWQHILFKGIRRDDLLKPYLLKVKFLSNHQNGKDSHVRALKIMAPLSKTSVRQDIDDLGVGFTSLKLMSESAIR